MYVIKFDRFICTGPVYCDLRFTFCFSYGVNLVRMAKQGLPPMMAFLSEARLFLLCDPFASTISRLFGFWWQKKWFDMWLLYEYGLIRRAICPGAGEMPPRMHA